MGRKVNECENVCTFENARALKNESLPLVPAPEKITRTVCDSGVLSNLKCECVADIRDSGGVIDETVHAHDSLVYILHFGNKLFITETLSSFPSGKKLSVALSLCRLGSNGIETETIPAHTNHKEENIRLIDRQQTETETKRRRQRAISDRISNHRTSNLTIP